MCKGNNLLSESQDGLDGDVHDHHTLGTEMEGENLQGVADEKSRETNAVEDTEDPDEGKLGVSSTGVGVLNTVCILIGDGDLDLGVLVDGGGDCPADEGRNHTASRNQEKRAATELVNAEGGSNGRSEIENGFSGGQLR